MNNVVASFVLSLSLISQCCANELFIEREWHQGIPTAIEVTELLTSHQSPYQKIDVYATQHFGTMLVADDIIMLTQFDNFSYHEMIVHVPLSAHPSPRRVLIVGGGDGGALQQVLKHPSVIEAVVCDIDQDIITLSQKYFPELASGFHDDRATIVVADAAEYIKDKINYFDVIIVDSTDPFGPGEVLFGEGFAQNVFNALTADGIVVTQAESMFYHTDMIAQQFTSKRALFRHTSYYKTAIPTYPSGTIGFMFCSKKHTSFEHVSKERISLLGELEYYNNEIHHASFALPEFLKRKILAHSLLDSSFI